MRVNSRVFDEKQDMFEAIRVPNCPSEFRAVAENILMMATKPGYSIGDYNTMTELDKNLMWDYWIEFDAFSTTLAEVAYAKHRNPFNEHPNMKAWFVKKATAPELIRRARQWLLEHQYIFVSPDVQKRAYEASSKFRQSIKG